jgi:hypothetical protein
VLQLTLNFVTTTITASHSQDIFAKVVDAIGLKVALFEMFPLVVVAVKPVAEKRLEVLRILTAFPRMVLLMMEMVIINRIKITGRVI